MHALLHSVPQCCSRPPPTHFSAKDFWTFTGKSGSASYEVTAPFSWVLVHTRFCLCLPRVCFPSPVFWRLYGGVNGDLLQEGLMPYPGLLHPAIAECHSCLGWATSFLLDLLVVVFCFYAVAYWTSSNLGGSFSGIMSFCLFTVSMEFSRKEYWSGLPFPSPMDHILLELFTMTYLSWVVLQSMSHSFTKLQKPLCHNKVVIHEGASLVPFMMWLTNHFSCGRIAWPPTIIGGTKNAIYHTVYK